ncbi:hypothetical protein AAG570_009438 [Ranatra chinensis]|uniref:Uncharacterized protein n=1 Tax=Ranatra chinensis TaxID=642074 RepID=A0ABD0YZY3_9HEMI
MASVFWDQNGILLFDFLPQEETINAIRYCETGGGRLLQRGNFEAYFVAYQLNQSGSTKKENVLSRALGDTDTVEFRGQFRRNREAWSDGIEQCIVINQDR